MFPNFGFMPQKCETVSAKRLEFCNTNMNHHMNTEHQNAIVQLKEKLTRIEALEAEVAPKGVSFAIRGQEDLAANTSNCVVSLRDPIAAADAVIVVLEDAKGVMAQGEEIAKRASFLAA